LNKERWDQDFSLVFINVGLKAQPTLETIYQCGSWLYPDRL